jgi:peptide/nickel transport system permease protein
MPGNPLANILGEDVQLSAEQLAAIEHELGLDLPLAAQFGRYLGRLVRLDLGYSYRLHRRVADLIASRLKWTLLLAVPAIVIGAVVGALAGAVAGFRPQAPGSKGLTMSALVIYSVPPYFLALLLLYLLSFRLGWFPLKGYYTTGTVPDVIRHLALPVIVLSGFTTTRNFMIMRGSVIQERTRHYVTYARAKGLGTGGVLFKHVFWNASLPLVTMIALDFGFVLSGALFVEIVFSMTGMGTLIFESVSARDYPVLQGAFLVIAIMVMGANLLADIAYGLLDPQVRRGR